MAMAIRMPTVPTGIRTDIMDIRVPSFTSGRIITGTTATTAIIGITGRIARIGITKASETES